MRRIRLDRFEGCQDGQLAALAAFKLTVEKQAFLAKDAKAAKMASLFCGHFINHTFQFQFSEQGRLCTVIRLE